MIDITHKLLLFEPSIGAGQKSKFSDWVDLRRIAHYELYGAIGFSENATGDAEIFVYGSMEQENYMKIWRQRVCCRPPFVARLYGGWNGYSYFAIPICPHMPFIKVAVDNCDESENIEAAVHFWGWG